MTDRGPYLNTSGFWPRVRARAPRAPVFWAHCHAKRGAARPHPSQLHIHWPKNYYQKLKLPSGPF
jgi:hypothetical protein